MTEVSIRPPLAVLSDDDLLAAWHAADLDDPDAFSELMTEMTRRDRLERTAKARAGMSAVLAEVYDAAHAQYLAASEYCRGRLLSELGRKRVTDEISLWTGSEETALRYASEELRDYWLYEQPRISPGSYARQRGAQLRAERERYEYERETSEGSITDEHERERDVMAGPEAGALRRDETAPPAPQGGSGRPVDGGGLDHGHAEGEPQDPGADGRPGGTVRGPVVTVMEAPPFAGEADTGRPATAAGYMAKAAGCGCYNSRYGTPAQCGDCPAPRRRPVRAPSEVAVPQTAAVARTAQPVDGARLLNIADAWMGKHVHMSDAARHTAVLYVAAQHFRLAESSRLAWPKFGKIMYVADQPGSGKTTAMVLMGYTSAPWFFGIDAHLTGPGLINSIRDEHACVFLDEFHRTVGPRGLRKPDVVAIANACYEKNGSCLNGKGAKASRVKVYAPMVIAGKDELLKSAAEEIGDLIDRCAAVVHMSRPPADVVLAEVTDATEAQGAAIAQRLAAWAAEQMADEDRFREAFTVACDRAREIGLTGRAKDVWVPLIATGWLASEGHADAACEAALEFRRNRPVQHEDEPDPLAGLEAELAGDGELPGW